MTFADEIAAWAENPQQIKLQLGELTAGELRTAQAVARMFAGKARDALRKAKADGMREGADMLVDMPARHQPDRAQLYIRADQIEKGDT